MLITWINFVVKVLYIFVTWNIALGKIFMHVLHLGIPTTTPSSVFGTGTSPRDEKL